MSKQSILLGVSSDCDDALDGCVFAAIPLDRVVLAGLRKRTRCFSRAREVYPDLYETHEFDCLPQWFGTGSSRSYDDPVDLNKLERLSFHAGPGDGESCGESLCAGLGRLEAQEINALLVSVEGLPRTGNLRTASGQLVMSPCGDASDIVDLCWICYLEHTDIALRTTALNSRDIDDWLTELARGDHHAEEATPNQP